MYSEISDFPMQQNTDNMQVPKLVQLKPHLARFFSTSNVIAK